MDKFRTVSAYHNYLVDGKLQAELSAKGAGGFFFQAHRLHPGERIPLISGRFFDHRGQLLLEVHRNLLTGNPHGFSLLEMREGWAIMSTALEALVSAQVLEFQKGLLSIIRGTLFDACGCKVIFGDDLGLHQACKPQNQRVALSAPELEAAFAWR